MESALAKKKRKPRNNKARALEYRKRMRYLFFWNDVMMEKKNS